MLKERLEQIENICERLGASAEIIKEVTTFRVHPVTIRPVLNGEKKSFEASRVWHCNPWTPNPYRGGFRRHHSITEERLKVFSTDMTVKCALTGTKSGGAKGGLIIDPKKHTPDEQRFLLELTIDEFLVEYGIPNPDIDVFGPDMGMSAEDMYYMYHRIGKLNRLLKFPNVAAAVTGKPVDKDGLPGREDSTAKGGLIVLRKFSELSSCLPQKPTLAIQGFGNVGLHLARLAPNFNFTVVAVSDVNGGIVNKNGLNFASIHNWYQEQKTFRGYPDATEISNEDLLLLSVDVLAPAAIENQITDTNADLIRASVVAELANEAVTHEARTIFKQRKTKYLPSPLISSGGVAMSGREWAHNRGHRQHKVELPEFGRTTELELKKIMEDVIVEIFNKSQREQKTLDEATNFLAFDIICRELSRKHGYKYK